MTVDLFAGVPVRDYPAALVWYERLFGGPPAFLPNDTEAVWELAEHRYVYIELLPEQAGHARHTMFVDDFEARRGQIAERGLEPTTQETYDNGVRKATYVDPMATSSVSAVARPTTPPPATRTRRPKT